MKLIFFKNVNIWCNNCFEIAIEKMKLLKQNLERKISLKAINSLWNDTYLYLEDTFLKKSHFWRTYFISHRSIVFRDLLSVPVHGCICGCVTLNIQWPDTGQSPPCSTGCLSLRFWFALSIGSHLYKQKATHWPRRRTSWETAHWGRRSRTAPRFPRHRERRAFVSCMA